MPRARERAGPQSPPDHRATRRGGGSAPYHTSAVGPPSAPATRRGLRPALTRSARALAAAVLLALSSALAVPAQAQTCTLDKAAGDIWCGVVTVADLTITTQWAGDGYYLEIGGALSNPKTFSVGTNDYTVDAVYLGRGTVINEELHFSLQSELPSADKKKLVLHVDGSSSTFAFSDASRTSLGNTYYWEDAGLDWSSATSVTVRLRVPLPALSKASVSQDGSEIELDFSENLDLQAQQLPTAAGNAFTITVDGEEVDVDSINWPGAQNDERSDEIVINFATNVYRGQAVVVRYDKSAAGSDAIADNNNLEVASFTTGVGRVPAVNNNSTVDPPAAPVPTNLMATPGGEQVTLAWDAPPAGAVISRHEYRYKGATGDYTGWKAMSDSRRGGSNATSYTATRHVNLIDYVFQVRAVNAGGASGPSNEAAATPLHPDAPPAPTVEAPSGTAGLLEARWTTPAGSSYEVRFWPADEDGSTRRTRSTTDQSILVWPLEANTEYKVSVKANGGPWSATATARTGAAQSGRPVLSLHLLDGGGDEIAEGAITEGGSIRYRIKATNVRNYHDWGDPAMLGRFWLNAHVERDRHYPSPWRQSSLDETTTPSHISCGDLPLLREGLSDAQPDFNQTSAITGYWDLETEPFPVGYAEHGPVTLSIQREDCGGDATVSGTVHPPDERDPNIGGPSSACVTIADDGEGDAYDYLPSNTLQEEFDDKPTYPCSQAGSTGALRGRFVSPPERHDGQKAVDMQVAFTRSVYESEKNVGEHGVRVRGGRVTSSRRVGRQPAGGGHEYLWEFGIKPESGGDMTVELDAGRPCDAPGAICTSDGRSLSEDISTTVEGPETDTGPPPLTASFEDLPGEHDGESAFTLRIAFSEPLSWMNGRRLREDVVAVAGGRATKAGRVNRRRDLWELTVEPDSPADVTVTLEAGAACGSPAAVCAKDGRALSETIAATVAGPDGAPANAPAEGAPTIRGTAQVGETLSTSTSGVSDADGLENATFAYQWIRTGTDIQGAAGPTYTAVGADEGKTLQVRVGFTDDAGHSESLTSAATGPVEAAPRANTAAQPTPKVSVADARVREAAGATLDFAVTLSAAAPGPVTVDYRTLDASAKAGEDYEARSGTLSFAAGETEKTLRVTVLDDAHDEGDEKMVVVLDPGPGVARGDRLAAGTIENSDPLPEAWLARFGRTASDHVVEAIAERWRGGEAQRPRTHFTLGGRPAGNLFGGGNANGGGLHPAGAGNPALPDESSWAQSDRLNAETPGPAGGGTSGGQAARFALMNALGLPTGGLRDVLMGSSFFYSRPLDEAGGQPGGLGQWAVWGRTAATRFSGADGKLALNGEVATAILGVDSRRDRWLAGVTLSYSEGEGAYTQPGGGGGVRSTLTSLNPYLQYRFSERTHLWAVAGYGVGGLTLTPEGSESVIDTDLEHAMAAFGGRGVFSVRSSRFGAFEFAVRSDALVTNTVSAAADNLISAAGAASRVRLMLEGSGSMPLGNGGMLRPTLEAGLRYDGGDAETGAGLEIGGGLGYAAGALAVEVRARLLLAHQDTEYEEWGFSGSIRYQPRSGGRGLSVNLGSTWGQAQSGVQSLWTRPDASGLAPVAAMHAAQRFQAELGYGFAGRRAGALWTPYAGIDRSGGRQALRLGVKLASGDNVEAGLEVGRLDSGRADGIEGPEHAVQLRGSIRW